MTRASWRLHVSVSPQNTVNIPDNKPAAFCLCAAEDGDSTSVSVAATQLSSKRGRREKGGGGLPC